MSYVDSSSVIISSKEYTKDKIISGVNKIRSYTFVEMKICISKTMVEFGPSEKSLNVRSSDSSSSIGTKRTVVIRHSGLIPPVMSTSIQSRNNKSSACIL